MAVATFNFTTGPATLPDVGTLSYNGCVFSPLFSTTVVGTAVKDEAQRTVKYMEYALHADGYVTMPDGAVDISPTMATLRNLLSKQAGALRYQGRGCDFSINTGGAGTKDVAWGPVPEILEFQPLGAGRGAKVRWECKFRIPEDVARLDKLGRIVGGIAGIPLLQFCYDTDLTYGEDGFSTISIHGVAEIPLTRDPLQTTRTLTQTVDDVRSIIEQRVMNGINLKGYRFTRRDFQISKDKRLLTWSITAEEKPYMDLPEFCTIARGSFSFRPAQAGMGLALWLCTLRASYTVRADQPRRAAWLAFLALLRLRMRQAKPPNVSVPDNKGSQQVINRARIAAAIALVVASKGTIGLESLYNEIKRQKDPNANNNNKANAWIIDLSGEEGLYLDSKTTSFSATWRLVTNFSHILLASGIWKKMGEENTKGENLWALSMQDVQGVESWHPNRLDPALDLIVDFGA